MTGSFFFLDRDTVQRLERSLGRIDNALARIEGKIATMPMDLATVRQAVIDQNVSIAHLIDFARQTKTSLTDISAQLAAAIAAQDPVALQGVVDLINQEKKTVDDAVADLEAPPAPAVPPSDTPTPAAG